MVKANDNGRATRGVSSARSTSSTQLINITQNFERLNSAKSPIEHPAAFLLDRIHTIELWRLGGKRLNLLQLGASLVRGVLQRHHHGANPLRVFDPMDHRVVSPSSADLASTQAVAHTEKECEKDEMHVAAPQVSPAASKEHGRPPQHRYGHHSEYTAPSPSIARVVLVHAARDASSELYMGLLVGLFGHGISSLALCEESQSCNADLATTFSTSSSSLPSDKGEVHTSDAAQSKNAMSRNPLSGSCLDTHKHLQGQACSSAAVKPSLSPRQRLSSEATHALHEVHHAAREIINLAYTDVSRLNVLFAETPTEQARSLRPDGESAPHSTDANHLHNDNVECDASPEVQLRDLSLRLTHLTANLYTLLSFLDFFSVEAAALPKASAATTASAPPEMSEENSGSGFVTDFSSSIAAAACAVAKRDSPGSGLSSELLINHNRSHNHTANVNPLYRHGTTEKLHSEADYTVERFQSLFDTAGHLPQCVWDVLSAAATALSQCDVSWSLTHGDTAVATNFNTAATVVFSEAQLSLLRQLHRLCRRFELLRQRVYALYPVSSARFKVKQMLDWAGFLYADDPTFRFSHEGYADLLDLHDDGLHKLYTVNGRWNITTEKKAILLVAATPYTPPTPVASAAGTTIPSSFTPRTSSIATDAEKMPVSSLLATLASVGTKRASSGTRNRFSIFEHHPHSIKLRGNTHYGGFGVGHAATPHRTAGRLSTVPGWVGMRNSGNTCFLNSVVQLLSSAMLFRENLIRRVQQAVFRRSETDARATSVVKAPDLTELFRKYGCRLAMVLLLAELQWRAQHRCEEYPVLPDYLEAQLPLTFRDHRQHDASEFLHALLDQLDEPGQPGGAVVGRWFSGKTATTMTCACCYHSRTHIDTFWDISTPILQTSPSDALIGEDERGGNSYGRAANEPPQQEVGSQVAQQVVEVERFPGATATTTTYVSSGIHESPAASLSSFSPAVATTAAAIPKNEGESAGRNILHKRSDNLKATGQHHTFQLSPSAEAAPSRAEPPNDNHNGRQHSLQHLLLHVLHPALNKEVLHGGNALDCEHCGRRTSTALTTQMVAEVNSEEPLHVCSSGRMEGETGEQAVVGLASVEEEVSANGVTLSTSECSSARGGLPETVPVPALNPKQNRSEGVHGVHSEHQSPSSPVSSSSNASSSGTAAGGGLPWYLVVQLNRFAYQRTTQFYRKVTDGVLLNEIVMVPAYPLEANPSTSQRKPTSEQTDDVERQPQQQLNGEENEETTAASMSTSKTVTATPVWVAYRLQTIIVHSGSTPSSGHYFALTRSPLSLHDSITSVHDEHHAQPSCIEKGRQGGSDTQRSVDLDRVRTYVRELGAAFTYALDMEHASSASTQIGSTAVPVLASNTTEHTFLHTGEKENEEKRRDNRVTRASVADAAAANVSEETEEHAEESSVSDLRSSMTSPFSPLDTSPTHNGAGAATATTAAIDEEVEEEICRSHKSEVPTEGEAEMQPPLLSPAPILPAAAASVSGNAFYEKWMMLNDSNVKAVPADTMRRILSGEGGGVYSALETPYLMLYEKLPVCYLADNNSSSSNSGGRSTTVRSGEEREETASSSNGEVTPARILQRVWEEQRLETLWSSTSPSPLLLEPVVLAPEAVAIFRARLHEEEARVQISNTPSTTETAIPSAVTASGSAHATTHATAPASASAGMLIPHVPPTTNKDAFHSTTTAASMAKSSSAATRLLAKTHAFVAPSSSGSISSKRLRAKAARYAEQTRLSKERRSRRRRTRAAATAAQAEMGGMGKQEYAEADVEEEDDASSSNDDVSLD